MRPRCKRITDFKSPLLPNLSCARNDMDADKDTQFLCLFQFQLLVQWIWLIELGFYGPVNPCRAGQFTLPHFSWAGLIF